MFLESLNPKIVFFRSKFEIFVNSIFPLKFRQNLKITELYIGSLHN